MKTKKYTSAYVAIEGIDGSGTTTQSKLVTQKLNSIGYQAVSIGEPGGVLLKKITTMLLKKRTFDDDDYRTLGLLFAGGRQEQKKLINQFVEDNIVVVGDRSVWSAFAYAPPKMRKWIALINRFCLVPKNVFLLHVTPKIALSRKAFFNLSYKPDIFENEAKLKTVDDEYLRILGNKQKYFSDNRQSEWATINGNQKKEIITDTIVNSIVEEILH